MAWVLLWFEATLRLRINSIKSELIPIRDVSNVEELASVFGCEVGKFPTTDLGLPLGTPFKSKVDWDVVEKRFFKRCPFGKGNTSQKEEESLCQRVFCATYQFTSCPFLLFLNWWLSGQRNSKGIPYGEKGPLRKAHLLNISMIYKIKRKEALALRIYPLSIRHLSVNGVGDLPCKEICFGKSL